MRSLHNRYYDALSELYENNNNYAETRSAAKECISYLEKGTSVPENASLRLFVMNSRIAYSYLKEGKEDEFINMLIKCISAGKQIPEPDCITLNNMGISYLNLSNYYYSQGEIEAGLSLSREAINYLVAHYINYIDNNKSSDYSEIEKTIINIFEKGVTTIKRTNLNTYGIDMWFRDLAFRLVKDGIVIGYSLMSIWFSYRVDTHKRIISLIKAAEGGISSDIEFFGKVEELANKDGDIAILLAESYFLMNNEEKGLVWMKKAEKLGAKGADIGLALKSKKTDNEIIVNGLSDANGVISFFDSYLYSTQLFDLSQLDLKIRDKAISYIKGIADARGGEVLFHENNATVEVRRTVFERDLVVNEIGDKDSEDAHLKEACNLDDIKGLLLMGKTVVVDFSECPTEKAQKAFDYLAGFIYGLSGTLDRKNNNVFQYIPTRMEYQGNR